MAINVIYRGNAQIINLYINKTITIKEHNILFEKKDDWFETNSLNIQDWNLSEERCIFFWKTLEKIVEFNTIDKNINIYDFSYIIFPDFRYIDSSDFFKIFNKKTTFYHSIFLGEVNFNDTHFNSSVDFSNSSFYGEASFHNTKFTHESEVTFNNTYFYNNAIFVDAEFKGKVTFANSVFIKQLNFNLTNFFNTLWLTNISGESLLSKKSKINNIHLEASRINHFNFIDVLGLNKEGKVTKLSSQNFYNKESVRIIKSDFEKEKNITESNKFYRIEMEKYRSELIANCIQKPTSTLLSYINNSYCKVHNIFFNPNYFVTTLYKYISNFGTDWFRPLLVMFIFGFFSSFLYSSLQKGTETINFTNQNTQEWLWFGFIFSVLLYISYHRKYWIALTIAIIGYTFIIFTDQDFRNIINNISQLINPLNIFKPQVNYFENIAVYGMLVKLGMSVLIYQFIMAFRQNTRRK